MLKTTHPTAPNYMISKVDPSRYADTGFSIADTPPDLNAHLFRKMLEKSGAERLIIGCRMGDSARQLVWSGIPKELPEPERRQLFLSRYYGHQLEID
jgi:hypothetical protein